MEIPSKKKMEISFVTEKKYFLALVMQFSEELIRRIYLDVYLPHINLPGDTGSIETLSR